jgi:hypothetical protein
MGKSRFKLNFRDGYDGIQTIVMGKNALEKAASPRFSSLSKIQGNTTMHQLFPCPSNQRSRIHARLRKHHARPWQGTSSADISP